MNAESSKHFEEASSKLERWLFLGDSITQAGHYVDYVETWFLLNEPDTVEIIDLGLSSETVSGLSELDHPFPRPDLHTRLDRVLERVKPQRVFACYGMNCGIYHPFSEERFEAYKNGIRELIYACREVGATVVLLTPPPYAGSVQPRPGPSDGESFGYKHPYSNYNDVLARYAEWILSLDEESGVQAINLRPSLERFMAKSYPNEPIHPAPFGHALMGEAVLRGLEKVSESGLLDTGIDMRDEDSTWVALYDLVRQQRVTYDRALLNDIGHGNPSVGKRNLTTMGEAIELVKPIEKAIDLLLANRAGVTSNDLVDRKAE